MALEPMSAGSYFESATLQGSWTVLDELTAAWERGQSPAVDDYLRRLEPADLRAAVELIYREFCLSEADGSTREASHYLDRFPQHRTTLEWLFRLHGECPPSLLDRWMETSPSVDSLPEAGDAIGPYVLRRELGRGSFARVFLAEQTNLENRLVVLKVSTRMTREPWLLARVRHAHIVEIVFHDRVNDDAFQLICMPFWGGATLAAVLAARRDTGRRPTSGSDLLADLDSVAAPEFPAVQGARPAREMLAGLSHGQAIAWVGARLAEALDHAFSRDVAHGDVKPSNILLSADGNPLLLDFNLARDWSPAGLSHSKIDPGGTLAYMAPERLRSLATHDPDRNDSIVCRSRADLGPLREQNSHSGRFIGPSRDEHQSGPHQADIYALGMVLLEALTGRPPAPVAVAGDAAPDTDFSQLKSAASAYASARNRAARATLHEAEAGGWRSINPGLRTILERCLDPDPTRRYRRGLELAEDLDRWRTDRPLICTSEPFWRQTVPRLVRRQRRAILTAALSLILILATTAVALVKSQQTLRALALHKIARLWDDPEARTYRFQKTNAPRLLQADDYHVEIATRALKEYDVLGLDDWRRRDDVRSLPKADREDLEVWLMEQVYLYCRALADRPHSPRDWSRAVKVLDHVSLAHPTLAFAALRHRLIASLETEGPISPALPAGTSAPRGPSWVNDYLLGVVAECELESENRAPLSTDEVRDEGGLNDGAMVRDPQERTRRAAELALDHYNNFLASHPDSYWGHYRAAAASYGLGSQADVAATADHLAKCLRRRPKNPMLHNHLAASLMALDRHREAQQEIETAIEAAPDLAEFYRTRARIRTTLGETAGLAEDLYHFELLSRFLPRTFLGQGLADHDRSIRSPIERVLPSSASLDFGIGLGDRDVESGGDRSVAEVDAAELVDRADLASKIRQAGEPELAAAELGKILILKPDDIGARTTRATQAIAAGRLDEAFPDIKAIIDNPRVTEYLRREAVLLGQHHKPGPCSLIDFLQTTSRRYYSRGMIEECRTIGRRALDLAIASKLHTADSHYQLAKAYVASDQTVSTDIGEAAEHLYCAFVAHPLYKEKYAQDATFNGDRVQLNAILDNKPDPSAEYHRRLTALSSPKGR
jgi:serine/threonine protein kinase/tetratricopeptide (TPR) repeat protein